MREERVICDRGEYLQVVVGTGIRKEGYGYGRVRRKMLWVGGQWAGWWHTEARVYSERKMILLKEESAPSKHKSGGVDVDGRTAGIRKTMLALLLASSSASFSPTAQRLRTSVKAARPLLDNGGWLFPLYDRTRPYTLETPEAQAFVATNVAFTIAGAAIATTGGDLALGALTEAAGIASVGYHASRSAISAGPIEPLSSFSCSSITRSRCQRSPAARSTPPASAMRCLRAPSCALSSQARRSLADGSSSRLGSTCSSMGYGMSLARLQHTSLQSLVAV